MVNISYLTRKREECLNKSCMEHGNRENWPNNVCQISVLASNFQWQFYARLQARKAWHLCLTQLIALSPPANHSQPIAAHSPDIVPLAKGLSSSILLISHVLAPRARSIKFQHQFHTKRHAEPRPESALALPHPSDRKPLKYCRRLD